MEDWQQKMDEALQALEASSLFQNGLEIERGLKIGDAKSGVSRTSEEMKNAWEANRGRVQSEEERKMRSEAGKGREFSRETRDKISKANSGRGVNTYALMSDSAKEEAKERGKKSLTKTNTTLHECPTCGKQGKGGAFKRYHLIDAKCAI